MSFCLLHACTCAFSCTKQNIVRRFTKNSSPPVTVGSSESWALARLFVHISDVHIPPMSLFVCVAEFFPTADKKKNPFSQRCPHWHLQILMVNNLISAACRWRQPGMWDDCTAPDPILPLRWCSRWSLEDARRSLVPWLRLLCEGARVRARTCACVSVCGPCVCIHFLPVCCAPSMLPQIPHPNHNYNVISRVRQCPRCCFTLSSSPLLWISNAVTLRSKSCTARSQIGVWRVCFYRLGWGRGCLIALSSSSWQ